MRSNCFKAMVLALAAVCLASSVYTTKAQHYSLISTDTKWRFSHQNLDFGTAWRANAYDDTVTGWEGPSNILFGFETTPAEYTAPASPAIGGVNFRTKFPDPVTEVPFVTNYYFRTHFTMPNVPVNLRSLSGLVTTNYIDDGCIYYLNGVEILRY